MRFMNNLRQVKMIIYRLKHNYGLPIVIRDSGSPSLVVSTGIETKDFNEYTVRKAIVLQGSETRSFVYDLSFIAANKNFTYGGLYDATTRVIIIARKDLPSDLLITLDFTIVFDEENYELKSIQKIKGNLGYLLIAKSLTNTPQVV